MEERSVVTATFGVIQKVIHRLGRGERIENDVERSLGGGDPPRVTRVRIGEFAGDGNRRCVSTRHFNRIKSRSNHRSGGRADNAENEIALHHPTAIERGFQLDDFHAFTGGQPADGFGCVVI